MFDSKVNKKILDKTIEELKLPNVLQFKDGKYVTNITEWEKRREEIKQILVKEEYGNIILKPHVPISFETIKEDDKYCGAKFIYKEINLTLHIDNNIFTFPIKMSISKENQPLKTFLYISFYTEFPNQYLPVEEICDRGFAVVQFCYTDITSDDENFNNGLSKYFYIDEKHRDFGKISIWAWVASHVMDYLNEVSEIDTDNIAIVGHSRLGKTALLASAFDNRFKAVFSNDAGQSGDSLSRGKTGEHIKEICDRFSYWFTPQYYNYINKEESLPFDQHFLLSLIAPRNLYVASASDNIWADPKSQFLALIATNPVYELYNSQGLVPDNTMPNIGEQLKDGKIGYHIRKGWHYLSRYDWNMFMDYFQNL